jgi:Flp pilus assembly protein TadD
MSRGKAIKECNEAIAGWPELSEAHFYLAVLANMSGNGRDAVKHAERAKELDPTLQSAWSLLAVEYRRAHEALKLKTLETDFLATFGRPLAR